MCRITYIIIGIMQELTVNSKKEGNRERYLHMVWSANPTPDVYSIISDGSAVVSYLGFLNAPKFASVNS
jgi:hypothetical protein